MLDTELDIEQLQVILRARTLLSYAPSLERVFAGQLHKLRLEKQIDDAVHKAVRNHTDEQLKAAREELLQTLAVEAKNRQVEPASRFVISTFLLSESFAYLRRQPEESLHLATGVVVGKTCTVETLVPVALSQATITSAEADKEALSRILTRLDRLGHCLTGVFHIHPGDGPNTTTPSGIDYAYMKRLAGRSLVFGIWSRDGFCRVLTVPRESHLQIYGDGLTETRKEHDAVIYKLASAGESLLGFH